MADAIQREQVQGYACRPEKSKVSIYYEKHGRRKQMWIGMARSSPSSLPHSPPFPSPPLSCPPLPLEVGPYPPLPCPALPSPPLPFPAPLASPRPFPSPPLEVGPLKSS